MAVKVERNGIVAYKPDWMTQEHWETYEAPRIGKVYGKYVYGKQYDKPSYGTPDDEDGCGGACTI